MGHVTIITGHYGCGKTNLAVNLAVAAAKAGRKVFAVDLDIVNPYFRTADFGGVFVQYGIELVASMYANSNLDIPAISFDLERIAREDADVMIDVGGDDDGALALGRYKEAFETLDVAYEMLYVINQRRLLTEKPAEALALLREIEQNSRLKATGIVNNTNLGAETQIVTILESLPYALEIARIANLPLLYSTVPAFLADKQEEIPAKTMPVEIYVKPIWE